ncbi:hypothetical protein DFH08DRAFT_818772 [Mycena albidolilacea]|uniref:Uncharacterized protein n=1 Tax=Mycena albidolilacea TaxID=1033008 RepID=A0AAD6ZFH1_9AGAR|nr:hypothetical protein DFH08DRAFT_818772 [Mycena albidolilacea]
MSMSTMMGQTRVVGFNFLDPDPNPAQTRPGPGWVNPNPCQSLNRHLKGSEQPLPQMSFVHCKQVLIWVSDPTLKMRIRGIVVLMSSHFDNIETEERLSIYEQEQIELSQ